MSIQDLTAEVRQADTTLTIQKRGVSTPLAQILWAGSAAEDRSYDAYEIYIAVALSRPDDLRIHTRRVHEHLVRSARWNPAPIASPYIGLPPMPGSGVAPEAELHIAVVNVEDCNYTPT